ncbi:MAG: hypothetical protein KKF95_06870, partial [Nanoarchaeota archaeon]|nr:hypothetical protein [Nanoarchaeota archaeon]
VGLVTIEDLLEELVGEIIDESDVTPNKIMRLSKKVILVDGETAPAYIKSFFHVNIPINFKTISDYLIDYNQGMPARGKKIKIDGMSFFIEEVGEKYIERIVIKKIRDSSPRKLSE